MQYETYDAAPPQRQGGRGRGRGGYRGGSGYGNNPSYARSAVFLALVSCIQQPCSPHLVGHILMPLLSVDPILAEGEHGRADNREVAGTQPRVGSSSGLFNNSTAVVAA